MGTNHVDNSARLCHAASTVAMKQTLGHGATTCSYRDWISLIAPSGFPKFRFEESYSTIVFDSMERRTLIMDSWVLPQRRTGCQTAPYVF